MGIRDLFLVGVLLPLLALAAARPFVGVLVWSWISFMNPHREVWGFASSLPWAMVTFVVTVFGCVVAREPKRLPLNAVTLMLIVFAVNITFTTAIAIGPPGPAWQLWDRTIKVILGLLLTASLLTDRRRIHAMMWLMVISLGYYGVKGGIFTLMTGGGFRVLGPPDTMISDRNHLAVALLITIPLMNYLRLNARHAIVRQGLAFAMASTLFAALGSQSRGALVALVATTVVFWLRSRGKIITGVLLAVAVAGAIAFMPDSWVARMGTIRNYEEDGSAAARLRIWGVALDVARSRPFTGGGFRVLYDVETVRRFRPQMTHANAAHSIWLDVLAEHGFLGFAVWLGILAAGLWASVRTVRLAKGRPGLRWAYDLARMSQVSAVAYMSGGTFLSLSYWDFFWTLLVVLGATHGLVVAAVRGEAKTAEPARAAVRAGWVRPVRQAAGRA